jgi:hypothetical protein
MIILDVQIQTKALNLYRPEIISIRKKKLQRLFESVCNSQSPDQCSLASNASTPEETSELQHQIG